MAARARLDDTLEHVLVYEEATKALEVGSRPMCCSSCMHVLNGLCERACSSLI